MKLILPLRAWQAASLGDWQDMHGPSTTASIEQQRGVDKRLRARRYAKTDPYLGGYLLPFRISRLAGVTPRSHTCAAAGLDTAMSPYFPENSDQQLLSGVIA